MQESGPSGRGAAGSDYIENRPETGEGLDMESEGKLVDISMALHQLMGLKAN